MKGLLSGGAWGVVIGGLAAGAASLIAEQPAGNTPPDAPQISAPETLEQDTAQTTAPDAVVAVTEANTVSDVVPRVAIPQPDAQAPVTDTASASLPNTGDVTDTLLAPDSDVAPQISIAREDPVLPNPQSIAPQVPFAEDDLVVATAPDPQIVIDVPVEDIAPTPEVAEQAVIDNETAQVEAAQDPVIVDTPVDEIAVVDTPQMSAPTDDMTDTAMIMTKPAQDSDVAVIVAPETLDPPEAPIAPDVETEPSIITPDVTPDTSTPEGEAPTVVTIIADPAPGLPTGDSGVRVNRPTVSTDDTVADDETANGAAIDTDAPATKRYGVASSNPENKPTVAVILIDDGSFAGAVPALAGIPFPVTVMLNPSSPDATEKMVAYRAAGIEVGILAQLPDGAQPSDVEVFFEAAFAALPETVAILDAGNAGFQSGNTGLITQTIAAVADDGRGLVTVSQGLNTALREAGKAGVPTGTVYRDLDSQGQDARVIRRFMDQAAFRARQESGVVLLGRVRADTISALILWGTANRAGQVALVPVTTIFDGQ